MARRLPARPVVAAVEPETMEELLAGIEEDELALRPLRPGEVVVKRAEKELMSQSATELSPPRRKSSKRIAAASGGPTAPRSPTRFAAPSASAFR